MVLEFQQQMYVVDLTIHLEKPTSYDEIIMVDAEK